MLNEKLLRISLPKPTIEKREIQMRSMTERMKDVFQKYKSDNGDNKGRIKQDNLSKQERAGLKEVKKVGMYLMSLINL